MHLEALETWQFRNLHNGTVAFEPGVNLVTGPNGQGKTNLIEAVYCACLSKSFRTHRADECAAHGARAFRTLCRVAGAGLPDTVETRLVDGVKRLALNGKETDVATLVERAPILCVTAEHFSVVSGGPEARRRFFDGLLSILQPATLQTLARYRRVLKQKMAVLRQNNPTQTELSTWNRALAQAAGELVSRRQAFAARFAEGVATERFSGAAMEVRYLPSLAAPLLEDPQEAEKFLGERAAREREAGRCLYGPHLDRYEILLEGQSARHFASSGQKRSILFTFYLHAIHLFHATRGTNPVVMVDDADMELDRSRILKLVESLGKASQLFLTSSKPELFAGALGPHHHLSVREGTVLPA